MHTVVIKLWFDSSCSYKWRVIVLTIRSSTNVKSTWSKYFHVVNIISMSTRCTNGSESSSWDWFRETRQSWRQSWRQLSMDGQDQGDEAV